MEIFTGCDIEEIDRFRSQNDHFFDLIYTQKEKIYCLSKNKTKYHSFAARFCGKEAAIKALYSMGIKKNFKEIEILNNANNVPYIVIHNDKNTLSNLDIKISLSHSQKYAIAHVVILRHS